MNNIGILISKRISQKINIKYFQNERNNNIYVQIHIEWNWYWWKSRMIIIIAKNDKMKGKIILLFQFDCHQMIYTYYLQMYWCRIRISGCFTKKLNENFLTIKRWLLNFLHHNYKNYIIFHLHNTISLLFCNFILTSNFQYSQTRVLLFNFFPLLFFCYESHGSFAFDVNNIWHPQWYVTYIKYAMRRNMLLINQIYYKIFFENYVFEKKNAYFTHVKRAQMNKTTEYNGKLCCFEVATT